VDLFSVDISITIIARLYYIAQRGYYFHVAIDSAVINRRMQNYTFWRTVFSHIIFLIRYFQRNI
jgi:hypothetical protein